MEVKEKFERKYSEFNPFFCVTEKQVGVKIGTIEGRPIVTEKVKIYYSAKEGKKPCIMFKMATAMHISRIKALGLEPTSEENIQSVFIDAKAFSFTAERLNKLNLTSKFKLLVFGDFKIEEQTYNEKTYKKMCFTIRDFKILKYPNSDNLEGNFSSSYIEDTEDSGFCDYIDTMAEENKQYDDMTPVEPIDIPF